MSFYFYFYSLRYPHRLRFDYGVVSLINRSISVSKNIYIQRAMEKGFEDNEGTSLIRYSVVFLTQRANDTCNDEV